MALPFPPNLLKTGVGPSVVSIIMVGSWLSSITTTTPAPTPTPMAENPNGEGAIGVGVGLEAAWISGTLSGVPAPSTNPYGPFIIGPLGSLLQLPLMDADY